MADENNGVCAVLILGNGADRGVVGAGCEGRTNRWGSLSKMVARSSKRHSGWEVNTGATRRNVSGWG